METLIEQDRTCIWHPFTQMQTARTPIPITHAKGVYLYAEDGRTFLDAISSWWVNLHGHAHPYIAEKISAQTQILEHVIFADFTHAPAVTLATRLLRLLPQGMKKLFFSDNGSTAVEVALKIALQYWHNKKASKSTVICFNQSYHGDTFGAMSASGKNALNRPFWTHLFEVESIDPPIDGQEENSLCQLETILKRNATACFIFEPLVLGSGGMILYSPSALDRLIACCKRYHVLTIADEVMTGFGRTGTLFACNQLQESPDLMCFSKGLTGGFLPLGATACSQEIYDAFLSKDLSSAFLHGHSYTGNPLACASALASLDLLEKASCAQQRAMIADSHHAFCEQWKGDPRLERCESIGTILVLEYRVDNPSYFHALRDQLYNFFLGKGVLLRPLGNVLYVMPPYCITKEELLLIYELIAHTLDGHL